MKYIVPYLDFNEAILERHEKSPSGYDLEKVAYKELVFYRWCETKDRVRDIIIAKRKRRGARMLARAVSEVVKKKLVEEEKQNRKELVQQNMKLTAKIRAGKRGLPDSVVENFTEEHLYMLVTIMDMRLRVAKGKSKNRIREAIDQYLGIMAAKGYATDMKEIHELVLLIPESEREMVAKKASLLKVL